MSKEGNKAIYGVDIQRYNYMVERAEEKGFKITVKYEGFELRRDKDQKYYGRFLTVDNILYFLNGFDAGKSEGRCEAIEELQKIEKDTTTPTSTECYDRGA